MLDHSVVLPSQPRVVSEDSLKGVYEIDGLYIGYGHTLGNSLRRIILSSLPGWAVTAVKIDGVPHEFSTLDGIKEDIITVLLNLKRVRFASEGNETQVFTCSVKGPKKVTAADIKVPGQVRVLNPDQYICEITGKTELSMEITLEKGLGYVPKEIHQRGKVDIGTIALDAAFTPIRRANYEVENMRVGDKTDYNRLRLMIETDGTLTPREALERSIIIMIEQLKAVVGFQEPEPEEEIVLPKKEKESSEEDADKDADVLKTRIESLDELSSRTVNLLLAANIRTVGGLVRKKEEDLLGVEGLGEKSVQEVRRALGNFGLTLKQ
ncbi:MAG: DNA-directed RNA polymerase subunit alpha [Candidatus Yonathbacteria bacterium]|nr:DNA-directed RNA polymerase subunit alpha [Candidatus Yonathbacteria bacterium]